MKLSKRPRAYELPPYSLTGDLLSFLRCGLQYRYSRIGQLPPTRPVQLWFGEYIHGVLEEAYRRYDEGRKARKEKLPPWSNAVLDEICSLIKRRLAAQGLFPWNDEVERQGDLRAQVAINELGPALFPIIHRAEVRLTGSRSLPSGEISKKYRFREAERYEMVGIIDVITHVELADPNLQANPLVQAIVNALPEKPPIQFEVIIDYKGMRRPPTKATGKGGPNYWEVYGWQVRTYAHLRANHSDSLPVVAGVILYINELMPTRADYVLLRQEIKSGLTDIIPTKGSTAEKILSSWREKDDLPKLPFEFRLARALRVIEVTPSNISTALTAFDGVVARIETCRGKELQHGKIINSWEKNASDEATCTACDARTFCPSYRKEPRPKLPAVLRIPR